MLLKRKISKVSLTTDEVSKITETNKEINGEFIPMKYESEGECYSSVKNINTNYETFRTFLGEKLDQLISEVETIVGNELEIVRFWSNTGYKGSRTILHNHHNAVTEVVAIYYPLGGEGYGSLVLHADTKVVVPVVKNLLVVHDPKLDHESTIHLSDESRVCLVFDFKKKSAKNQQNS